MNHDAALAAAYRRIAELEALTMRWNKAMSAAGICGSEFINEPERCGEHVKRMRNLADSLAQEKIRQQLAEAQKDTERLDKLELLLQAVTRIVLDATSARYSTVRAMLDDIPTRLAARQAERSST